MNSLQASELQDLKSRKVLTDLLSEQIDLNEEITLENRALDQQQKQLLLLLESKDVQLDQYKNKLLCSENIQNYLYERSLKFCILDAVFYRLQFKLKKQAFDQIILKNAATKEINLKLTTLASSSFALRKKNFLKGLSKLRLKHLLNGFLTENNVQRRKTGLTVLHVLLEHKTKYQLLDAFSEIRTIAFKNTELRHAQEDTGAKELSLAQATERNAKFLQLAIKKLMSRVMLDALREIRLKPIQKVASRFSHLKNMTKKFLAITSIFNMIRRLRTVSYSRAFQNLVSHSQKHSLMIQVREGQFRVFSSTINKLQKRNGFIALKAIYTKSRALQSLSRIRERFLLRSSLEMMSQHDPAPASILRNITNFPLESSSVFRLSGSVSKEKENQNWVFEKEDLIKGLKTSSTNMKPTEKPKLRMLRRPGDIKRDSPEQIRRKVQPLKGRYMILLSKYKANIKGYSSQMKAYLSQMQARIQNFQKLNDNLVEESKQARQQLEDFQKQSFLELNQKEMKYRHYIEELESKMKQVQTASENQTSLNAALKNKLAISSKHFIGFK